MGVKQVRAHPGDVADVVADIIGDNRGVAGVVFGNTEFDFADEVGADVGGFREDPAARFSEQGEA